MTKTISGVATALIVAAAAIASGQAPAPATSQVSANETLFEAARAGDVAKIQAALAQGADVNATSRYNVNAEDSFYHGTAIFVRTMGHVYGIGQ